MVFSSEFFFGWEKFTILQKKSFGKAIFYHKFLAFSEKKSPNFFFLVFKNHQKPSLLLTTVKSV